MKKRLAIILISVVFSAIMIIASPGNPLSRPGPSGQRASDSMTLRHSFVSSKDVFGTRIFVENKGQFQTTDGQGQAVHFGFENGDEFAYFTSSGVTFKQAYDAPNTEWESEQLEETGDAEPIPPKISRVTMKWVNANPNVSVIGSEWEARYFTYGDTSLNSYVCRKIIYKNIYDKIDVEYTIPRDKEFGIKYCIILYPGANPQDIKMAYQGDVLSMAIDSFSGDLIVQTPNQQIVDHNPISRVVDASGQTIRTTFELHGNTVSFVFQSPPPVNERTIIDPWVTTTSGFFPPGANAYDVDYDYAGNVYVYGSEFPMVSKYSPTGTLLWTFSGYINAVSPPWDGTGDANYGFYSISNFVVNKLTSKCYVGQGAIYFGGPGIRIVRLAVNGSYDNFITTPGLNFREIWEMGYNPVNNDILGFGGSTQTNLTGGVVNQSTASFTPTSFVSNYPNVAQDVTCSVIDQNGALYVMYNSAGGGSPILNNRIAKIKNTLIDTVWTRYSGYPTLEEGANKYAFGSTRTSAGFNCLAVNSTNLYFYDGYHIVSFNKATGISQGSTVVAPHATLGMYVPGTYQWHYSQGGIAVDNCDNVYVGGMGEIRIYHFDGVNFSFVSSFPTNSGSNTSVYDIKYDQFSNQIFACGSGFVGIYNAVASSGCTPILELSQIGAPTYLASLCTGQNFELEAEILAGLPTMTIRFPSQGKFGIAHLEGTKLVINDLAFENPGTFYGTLAVNGNFAKEVVVDVTSCIGEMELNTAPNPFENGFTINFSSPSSARLVIELYNDKGEFYASIWQGDLIATKHYSTSFSEELPHGIYFLRVSLNGKVHSRKLLRL